MMHAFTIDLEDYFQVSAFADRVSIPDWDHIEPRVEIGARKLLALLARFNVRATFFVLGWVAERHPGLVREIHEAGHEIASHSHHHQLVYDLDPEEFRRDLRRSRDVLEDLTGTPVIGYRAPSFSIVRKSLWALDILAEEGFQYDSSIYPIRHDRYGIPEAEIGPHLIRESQAIRPFWEFPGTVCQIGGCRVPVGGGGYFRLYPYALSAALMRQAAAQSQRPFMFYIHPWELDPEQPRMPGSLARRWRHRVNLAATEARLARLLSDFSFGAMSDVLRTFARNSVSNSDAVSGDRSEAMAISSPGLASDRPVSDPSGLEQGIAH